MPADKQKKIFVLQRKLEGMYNDIQELKRTVASLQQSPDQSGN
jgi:hypothetical protein